jgi:hypothetical protein
MPPSKVRLQEFEVLVLLRENATNQGLNDAPNPQV